MRKFLVSTVTAILFLSPSLVMADPTKSEIAVPSILKGKPEIIPFATPSIKTLSGKCVSDNLDELKDALHTNGYTALMVGIDKTRPEVTREIMFNKTDGSIVSIALIKTGIEDDAKLKKICVEYVVDHMTGDGPTMKSFILNQHIWDQVQKEDKREAAKKSNAEKENEPYQGDNFHI